jgi:streptomycin 6-kinase
VLDTDFVLDAAARDRLIDRFGAGAGPWCDALPGLVEECGRRWGLELDEALSGGTSRVFIGRRRGGRGVVLKLTPDRSVAETEALALHAWARTPHVVDLLEADTENGALLLEKVEPGTRLADQPGLPSFEDIAGLLASLRVTDADLDGRLPALTERVEFLFGLIGRRVNHARVRSLVTPDLAERGHRLARSLAAGGHTELVHGDLGLPNVLIAGPERGLVAIDPRPTLGDRTADAIDWAIGRATSAAELDHRIERLCALDPDLNADRLRQWCQATAVVIAVQHLYRRPPDATTRFLLQLAASA